MIIDTLPGSSFIVGEAPHWDIDTQSLYFVDVGNPRLPIHRFDYGENKIYSASITGAEYNQSASFIIPVADEPKQFLLGMGRKVNLIEWDGRSTDAQLLRSVGNVNNELDDDDYTINDAKADRAGRVFFGTLHGKNCFDQALSCAFKFDKNNGITKLFDDVYISNGLEWNEKIKKFYFIDSKKDNIMEFDYDPSTGNISNGHVIIEFHSLRDGYKIELPDGMTIDSDGFLYVAKFNGSKVVKVDPRNCSIVQEIPLPVNQITSVAFGGPNLDILFVTTASKYIFETPTGPAGCIFKITNINGQGLPMNKAKI